MRIFFLLFLVSFSFSLKSQAISANAIVQTLYSENRQYYLISIPYDVNDYTILGTTTVYKVGQKEALYSLDRSFNYFGYPNKLTLSNDGRTIFYVNDIYGNDEEQALNTITVYINGILSKQYALSDLSDCDSDIQNCSLLYRNEEVINRDSSKWEGDQIIPGIKQGTSSMEKFANLSNLFSSGDTIYLIDQSRNLLRFDLKEGTVLASANLAYHYSRLKELARTNRFSIQLIKGPSKFQLPPLNNGLSFKKALANHLEMMIIPHFYGEEFQTFKGYRIDIGVIIDTKGKVQILDLSVESGIPSEKVRHFLENQSYDMAALSPTLKKWYYDETLLLRKSSDSIAKREKGLELIANRKAYQTRIRQDSLKGFYIPKDLEEAIVQLDLLLKPKERAKIKSSGGDTALFHMNLGMYLRNNWSLWGGSRLREYFDERGFSHPDMMSGVILDYYYKWLHGNKEPWRDWEREFPVREK